MIVISDTSVVSGLLHAKCLHLIQKLYGNIVIPKQVFLELETSFQGQLNLEWIEIKEITRLPLFYELIQILDPGEAEAITLAKELNADLLLIDERRGRTVAGKMGLKITGILGTLIEAKRQHHIQAVKPVIDVLTSKASFRLSKDLIEEVLKIVNEY